MCLLANKVNQQLLLAYVQFVMSRVYIPTFSASEPQLRGLLFVRSQSPSIDKDWLTILVIRSSSLMIYPSCHSHNEIQPTSIDTSDHQDCRRMTSWKPRQGSIGRSQWIAVPNAKSKSDFQQTTVRGFQIVSQKALGIRQYTLFSKNGGLASQSASLPLYFAVSPAKQRRILTTTAILRVIWWRAGHDFCFAAIPRWWFIVMILPGG